MRFSTAFATVLAVACTSALAAPTAITARDVQRAVAGISKMPPPGIVELTSLEARARKLKRVNAPRPPSPHPNGETNGHATNGDANGHATNGDSNGHAENGDNTGGSTSTLPNHFPPALVGQVGSAPAPHNPEVTTHNPEGENAQEQHAPVEEWPGERRALNMRRRMLGSALRKRVNAPRPPSPHPNGETNGHATNGDTNGHATNGDSNGHAENGDNTGGSTSTLPNHFPPALVGQVGSAPAPHNPEVTTHNPEGENAPEQHAPVEEWPGERRMFWGRDL
ncbi:hypothetical protein EIP91_010766 [Steccherinum ochraceum]|uniref:Uncharacterized protein n=1 Tax=Steccherinum ochraceum TaxID=92696 RepID=A0A4R0R848_9APHY|nr:hypothetical protein EIP91_010766 [Steccherinum ochraceum]